MAPAVDRHEGFPARCFPVDQLRHAPCRAAFSAVDQHRRNGQGHQPDVFVLPGGVATALDVVERLLQLPAARGAAGLDFADRRRQNIQRFTDLFQQFRRDSPVWPHGLAMRRSHAPHGVLDFGVTRHHDHRRRDTSRHPLQQGDAVLRPAGACRSARAKPHLKSRAPHRRDEAVPTPKPRFESHVRSIRAKVISSSTIRIRSSIGFTKIAFFQLPRQSARFPRRRTQFAAKGLGNGPLRTSRPAQRLSDLRRPEHREDRQHLVRQRLHHPRHPPRRAPFQAPRNFPAVCSRQTSADASRRLGIVPGISRQGP